MYTRYHKDGHSMSSGSAEPMLNLSRTRTPTKPTRLRLDLVVGSGSGFATFRPARQVFHWGIPIEALGSESRLIKPQRLFAAVGACRREPARKTTTARGRPIVRPFDCSQTGGLARYCRGGLTVCFRELEPNFGKVRTRRDAVLTYCGCPGCAITTAIGLYLPKN